MQCEVIKFPATCIGALSSVNPPLTNIDMDGYKQSHTHKLAVQPCPVHASGKSNEALCGYLTDYELDYTHKKPQDSMSLYSAACAFWFGIVLYIL